MLMIYSLPVGLLVAGPLISLYGYRMMAIIYCMIGLAATAWIAARWRAHVWAPDAQGNKH
jgi:hypothetical protein